MQDYIPEKRDPSLTMEHSKSFISLSSSFSSAPQPGYASSEPSASASSVMISPPGGSSNGGGQADNILSGESSDQSGSVLKEHDYIGLAEVSSAAAATKELLHKEADCVPTDLNLEETDLRLGLGPVKRNDTEGKESDKRKQDAAKSVADAAQRLPVLPLSGHAIGGLVVEGATSQELVNIWKNPNAKSTAAAGHGFQPSHICMPVPDYVEAAAVSTPRGSTANTFEAAKFVVPTPKNGIKRGYMEAMSDVLRYATTMESRPAVAGTNTGASSVPVRSGDSDLKALPKHQQAGFLPNWTPTKPAVPSSWPVGLDQPATNYNASKLPSILGSHVEKPNDSSAVPYKTPPEESISNDAPPAKGAVIGWPPIRSYRKNTLAKPAELFVKVNMDGITVGRKVDLNAHTSYDGLLSALEDMFQPTNSGQGASQVSGRESIGNDGKHFRLRNSSEYVLTYEDKDGDWMLVGDVPWSMFVNTVRRLRIIRGSESSSLVLRGPEKPKCLA